MLLALANMDMNSTHHSFPLVVPSTPRPRIAQKPQPVMEKPEESERFRMRRMRIRQYEREQALEDKAAVIMIQVRYFTAYFITKENPVH